MHSCIFEVGAKSLNDRHWQPPSQARGGADACSFDGVLGVSAERPIGGLGQRGPPRIELSEYFDFGAHHETVASVSS